MSRTRHLLVRTYAGEEEADIPQHVEEALEEATIDPHTDMIKGEIMVEIIQVIQSENTLPNHEFEFKFSEEVTQ